MDAASLFSRANSTTSPTMTWHSDPNVRGTWDIISTCLATLVICAWNAVHSDIHLHENPWNFLHKLGWLLAGILAPDMLLYAACCQLSIAYHIQGFAKDHLDCPPGPPSWYSHPLYFISYLSKALMQYMVAGRSSEECKRYRRLREEEVVVDHGEGVENPRQGKLSESDVERTDSNDADNAAPHEREHPWTLVHSFYAAMGGFVFETSSPILPFPSRFKLTREGAIFLIKYAPELLSDLSEASILNRSRSDGFGKAILILQLLYFCISCISRWAQSLPVTLLEVSTFAHAICAIATCCVWWKKPFDVAEPTVISGVHADEVVAYFLLSTDCPVKNLIEVQEQAISERMRLIISPSDRSDASGLSEAAVTVDESLQELDIHSGQSVRVGYFTFSISDKDPGTCHNNTYDECSLPWFHRDCGPGGTVHLEKEDLTRWRFAARAMARFGICDFPSSLPPLASYSRLQASLLYSKGITWWPCIPSIIAAVYGSIHLFGWDTTFPSSTDRIHWRIAAPAMIVVGLLAALTPLIADKLVQTFGFPFARIWLLILLLYALSFSCYVYISMSLIFESIKQLFYLPVTDAAFKLPDYSIYLPHFA